MEQEVNAKKQMEASNRQTYISDFIILKSDDNGNEEVTKLKIEKAATLFSCLQEKIQHG